MNKQRRSKLKVLIDMYEIIDKKDKKCIEELREKFITLQDEEQNAYDNMPESFQDSSRGIDSEDAIDEMQDYIDELDEILCDLN